MNMKKMRGVVDPFTLGFLIAGIIGAAGVATSANIQKEQQLAQTQQANVVNPTQASYQAKGPGKQYVIKSLRDDKKPAQW